MSNDEGVDDTPPRSQDGRRLNKPVAAATSPETSTTPQTAARVLARQLAAVRNRRGLTADRLARRCTELGAKRVDRSVIAKIESSARSVSLDEAIILAAALDVALVHLIAPLEDDQEIAVTAQMRVPAPAFRAWVRGQEPLPGHDDKPFRTEVPSSEWQRRRARISAARREVESAWHRLRVANEKADLILEKLGELPSITVDNLSMRRGQTLEARLDSAYDRIAEARVELEDSQDWLSRVHAEELAEQAE